MNIIADSGGILTAMNKAEPGHDAFLRLLDEADHPVVTTFVVTEVHHMLTKAGRHIEAAEFLSNISDGYFELATTDAQDFDTARSLISKYQGTMQRKRRKPGSVDLADAMNMIAAEKYGTNLILATDQDYRSTTPLTRHPYYVILPEDETN